MSDDQRQKERENDSPLSGQEYTQANDSDASERQAQDSKEVADRGYSIDLNKKSPQPQPDDGPHADSVPDAGAGDDQPGKQAGSHECAGQEGAGQEGAGQEGAGQEEAGPASGSEAANRANDPENAPVSGTGPAQAATCQAGDGGGLAFAAFGPFLLIFFLAAMYCQDLWQHLQGHGLFWPQEVASLVALEKAMPEGQWLLQVGPGASLSDPLPGFYWFAGGLAYCLPWLETGVVSQIAASLATAILLLAVWFLAICSGLGGRAAVAAGMVLVCTPIFALSGNLFGPQTLACALMLLSLACFSRGWQAGVSWLSLPAGFVLAGLAGLTGGLFHLLLPLAASLVLLVWRGTFRRAQGADAIAGFCLMLILVIGWLALTILRVAPKNGLDGLVASQVQLVWPLASECWWIPCIAALGLLPWLLLPCCVSWWDRILNAWGDLKASRKERSGVAFLWISLCLTIACSVLASRPGSPYLASLPICLACLAAPLAGSAYSGLSSIGRRFFHSLLALLLVACGLAMLALSFSISVDVATGILPEQLLVHLRKLVPALSSLPMLGLAFLLAAIGMIFFFVIRQCQGALLYCVLVCVAFYQIGYFLMVRDLAAAPGIELKSLEYHLDGQNPDVSAPAEPEIADKPQTGQTGASQPDPAMPTGVDKPASQNAAPGAGEGVSTLSGTAPDTPGAERPSPDNDDPAQPVSPDPDKAGQTVSEQPAARDDVAGDGGLATGDGAAVGGGSAMTGSEYPETAGQPGNKSGQ